MSCKSALAPDSASLKTVHFIATCTALNGLKTFFEKYYIFALNLLINLK